MKNINNTLTKQCTSAQSTTFNPVVKLNPLNPQSPILNPALQPIYLTSAYESLVTAETRKEPRQRFVEYYQDLHKLYGRSISPDSFTQGTQQSYTELGERVFAQCSKQQLAALDPIVFAMWAHEFDPEHATCGSYFAHKYNLTGKIFDVCDQGSVCNFTALQIARLFLQNPDHTQAAVIGLEQSTIPRDLHENIIIPVTSGAVMIMLAKQPNRAATHSYQLLDSKIVTGSQLTQASMALINVIKNDCGRHKIAPSELAIASKSNSRIIGMLGELLEPKKNSSGVKLITFDERPGAIQLLMFLHRLISGKETIGTARYLAIFDADVESPDIGFMLLKIIPSSTVLASGEAQ